MNKSFNAGLYRSDDLLTKQVVVEFLNSLGWMLATPLDQQPEAYKDWDFLIQNPAGKDIPIEVERVYTWNDRGRRPPRWPNFSVPFRKAESKATYIFRVNRHFDSLAFTTMDAVRKSTVRLKDTINGRSGEVTKDEPFYDVEFPEWRFATKFANDSQWHRVDQHGEPLKP